MGVNQDFQTFLNNRVTNFVQLKFLNHVEEFNRFQAMEGKETIEFYDAVDLVCSKPPLIEVTDDFQTLSNVAQFRKERDEHMPDEPI
jgi:hypothetical protein